jgi:anthranilate synthase/aminodeoxychorismate synthase-like glutamine amidotransferase
MHGKTSMIEHADAGVFKGVEHPLEVTRYHSLVLRPKTLPDCLEVTAWTRDASGERDEIMAIRHRELPIQGMQFHPESVLTRQGHRLLDNFLQQV